MGFHPSSHILPHGLRVLGLLYKGPQAGGLPQQTLTSLQGWRLGIQVQAGLLPSEVLLLDLQMGVLSLSLHSLCHKVLLLGVSTASGPLLIMTLVILD